MKQSTEFITFYLGEFFFGIVASDVLELNRDLKITPVPRSPGTVRGIVNLRGEIVPAINMHARFNLDSSCRDDDSISIILKSNGLITAALVDDVGEIVVLYEDTFEPPPKNFPEESKSLILGVHKLPDKLLLIVDSKKIAEELTQSNSLPKLTDQSIVEH
ncbi:MAG: chemotaxis protein CheW [Alcaligenaceae bacterium]